MPLPDTVSIIDLSGARRASGGAKYRRLRAVAAHPERCNSASTRVSTGHGGDDGRPLRPDQAIADDKLTVIT